MQVLITGGTGFIGRALCADLVERGHSVTVLTRAATTAPALRGVRLVESLAQAGASQAVVNLAGENLSAGRWGAARKRAFRDSRLDMTRDLLDWIAGLERRPQVLVSGSAIGWYGSRGDEMLDENSTPGADFAAQLCRDWEAAALPAEGLGVRVCRLRIGVVLHPSGGALAQMLPPFRLGLGGPTGDGRQWLSWIARDDLVRMIGWLLENPEARGAYNGVAPEPVTSREFAQALGAGLHRTAVLPMPAFALRLLFGEMASLLLGSQRVQPARALAQGFVFRQPDCAAALREMLGSRA